MNERECALYILMEIFETKGYSNIVLRKHLRKNNSFSKYQKAFITEIVNGTLRNIILIDYVIDLFSNTKTKKMKPIILNILRISVYQIMFMNKVPVSAVCNEAVNISKKSGFKGLSGFVNGVLRNILRNLNSIRYPDEKNNKIKFLSIKYSYPEWIIEYWLKEFSFDEITKMCAVNNLAPTVNICVNTNKITPSELKQILKNDSINVDDEESLYSDFLRISKTSDISKNKSYLNGLFHIMDISSGIAVKILDPKPHEKILDVCAAPGGKSFYAAYLMKNKGSIVMRDIYEHKLELIQDMKNRLDIDIIDIEKKDASICYDEDVEKFDKVIVDAPCSGLGLVRKKPDIKFLKTFDDVLELAQIQKNILSACCKYVKKGGILVYSTCTLSLYENSDNVEWFLNKFPFKLIEKRNILPQDFNSDGFFISKFVRV